MTTRRPYQEDGESPAGALPGPPRLHLPHRQLPPLGQHKILLPEPPRPLEVHLLQVLVAHQTLEATKLQHVLKVAQLPGIEVLEDTIANQLAEQHILAQTHLGRLNYVVLILDVTIPASLDAFGDGVGHILWIISDKRAPVDFVVQSSEAFGPPREGGPYVLYPSVGPGCHLDDHSTAPRAANARALALAALTVRLIRVVRALHRIHGNITRSIDNILDDILDNILDNMRMADRHLTSHPHPGEQFHHAAHLHQDFFLTSVNKRSGARQRHVNGAGGRHVNPFRAFTVAVWRISAASINAVLPRLSTASTLALCVPASAFTMSV